MTRRTLVVAEVALALVLLVSAGLLLRSLERLFAVAPGFDASHLLTMQVQTSGHRFDGGPAVHRFFAQALDAVREVPGVTSAAFTSQLPLSGDLEKYGVHFESSPNDDPEEDHSALRYAVSPGYFETMGIPLRRGRLLDAHDTAGKPVAVLISESFAKRKFPGQDPIGQRLHVGSTTEPWYTIVGVVGDVKQTSLAAERVGCGVHDDHAVVLRGQRAVARGSRARRRGGAGARRSGARSGRWTRISRLYGSPRWTSCLRRRPPSDASR